MPIRTERGFSRKATRTHSVSVRRARADQGDVRAAASKGVLITEEQRRTIEFTEKASIALRAKRSNLVFSVDSVVLPCSYVIKTPLAGANTGVGAGHNPVAPTVKHECSSAASCPCNWCQLRQATPGNQTHCSRPVTHLAYLRSLRIKIFFASPPYDQQCRAARASIPPPATGPRQDALRRGRLRRHDGLAPAWPHS